MAEKEASEAEKSNAKPPALEWLAAAFGFVLVFGAVGFLVYEAVGRQNTPPEISVQIDSINPTSGGFLVRFRVINRGGATASALNIEGELKKDGASVETSSATVDYAPSDSERRGGLIFTKNPREHELEIRAAGYEEP